MGFLVLIFVVLDFLSADVFSLMMSLNSLSPGDVHRGEGSASPRQVRTFNHITHSVYEPDASISQHRV